MIDKDLMRAWAKAHEDDARLLESLTALLDKAETETLERYPDAGRALADFRRRVLALLFERNE